MIDLRSVEKTYTLGRVKVEALRQMDLSILKGEAVAITGESGAGKTTLLHIIGTLDRPSAGKVVLAGTDLTGMNDAALSRFRNLNIGFIFQSHNLLSEFSALENVMMPGLICGVAQDKIKNRAMGLLDSVGVAARAKHTPSELSGGEKQRVAIARALLMSPGIILADEPTGNLDKKNSFIIANYFSTYANH